ncbi:MAG: hypothetical protein HRU08_12425, partial [Oleispira sp.]|nr:hypothetical protein [Oleispira sp.]
MRLCLVSSILTFFISIRFQSEQVLGLSLLIVLLLVWHFHSWKIRLFAVVCIIATGCYSHAWLSERLASRLPASLSGSLVDGVADVIGCNNANPEVERLLLRVRSFQFSNKIKNTNQVFPQLKQLALNYYRHDKKPGF